MKVTIRRGDESETHDVKTVEHDVQEYDDDGPHEPGDEFWVVKDIQPSETDLISSEFVWLSGSMADPRAYEGERSPFPLVYIPKDSELEVEFDE